MPVVALKSIVCPIHKLDVTICVTNVPAVQDR
jgi:hypothetical protein